MHEERQEVGAGPGWDKSVVAEGTSVKQPVFVQGGEERLSWRAPRHHCAAYAHASTLKAGHSAGPCHGALA